MTAIQLTVLLSFFLSPNLVCSLLSLFFFFNERPTPEFSPLPHPDPLPIPQPPIRGADGDLRGARPGGQAAPPPRLPGDRHLRALDRGDGAPCPSGARGAEKRRVKKNEKEIGRAHV